jgi:hypothetical protein
MIIFFTITVGPTLWAIGKHEDEVELLAKKYNIDRKKIVRFINIPSHFHASEISENKNLYEEYRLLKKYRLIYYWTVPLGFLIGYLFFKLLQIIFGQK